MEARYIAIGASGVHYNLKHPRKDLLERLGRKHADKVYVDRDDGTYHIGYIIAGDWIRVYGIEGTVFETKSGEVGEY